MPPLPTKPTILLFGPDADLKKIKAKFCEENPGYDVLLRTGDRFLGFVETTPVQRRIICHGGASEALRHEFVTNGLDVDMAYVEPDFSLRYDDIPRTAGARIEADAPKIVNSSTMTELTAFELDNGKRVNKEQAIGRAAVNLGVSVELITSLDPGALADAVHAAYDITREQDRQNKPFREIEPVKAKAEPKSQKRPKAPSKKR